MQRYEGEFGPSIDFTVLVFSCFGVLLLPGAKSVACFCPGEFVKKTASYCILLASCWRSKAISMENHVTLIFKRHMYKMAKISVSIPNLKKLFGVQAVCLISDDKNNILTLLNEDELFTEVISGRTYRVMDEESMKKLYSGESPTQSAKSSKGLTLSMKFVWSYCLIVQLLLSYCAVVLVQISQ